MNINSRIKLLSKLGRFFSAYLKKNNNEFDKRLFNFTDKKVQEAIYQNSFFDFENIAGISGKELFPIMKF